MIDPTLPGAELVARGLADLQAGLETDCSLLVALASDRLRANGVPVPEHAVPDPDMRLYHWLAERHGDDAHSRYNALLRRLISFEHAMEARRGRVMRLARAAGGGTP